MGDIIARGLADQAIKNVVETNRQLNQVDFVKLLQDHNEVASGLYARIVSPGNFEIYVPFKGNLVARYQFYKDSNDDYIKYCTGSIGRISENALVEKERKKYDASTGVIVSANPPNLFTTEIGATVTKTFNGTGVDWYSYCDNRGGIWEFVLDGNAANKVQISVWATGSSYKKQQLFRNATKGEHTIVGTFKGADPANAPTGGTANARGWIYDSEVPNISPLGDMSQRSFTIYTNDGLGYENIVDVMADGSNKDFAVRMKPFGSAKDYQFFPEHSAIGTAFLGEQVLYLDNKPVTDWKATVGLVTIKSAKLVQKMIGKFPTEETDPLCEIYSVQTVNAKGVSLKFSFKFLRKAVIDVGYSMMFPFYLDFAKYLLTSNGKRYDIKPEGAKTYLTEKDTCHSFALLPNETYKHYLCAMTIQNPDKTLRRNETEGKIPNTIWLEHRNSSMNKLYPQIFSSGIVEAGYILEGGGTFFIGEFPYANEML